MVVIEATNGGGLGSGTAAHARRLNDKFSDKLTGLAYYGARYFDNIAITWTQGDPLFRFVPDAAGALPRASNLYAFSLNNPLRYIDPDGQCVVCPYAPPWEEESRC